MLSSQCNDAREHQDPHGQKSIATVNNSVLLALSDSNPISVA